MPVFHLKIRFLIDITRYLTDHGISEGYAHKLNIIFGICILIVLAWLADLVTKWVINTIIFRIVKKTETIWDDIIYEKKVFNRLSHLAPALVLYYASDYILAELPQWAGLIQDALNIYMIIIAALVTKSFLQALHEIYQTFPNSQNRSIKGYVQIGHIIIYSVAAILILSIVLGKSPLRLLAGLSALAAVLLLVFKDTLLGLVASVQLSANNMLQIGDWITMPKYNADGTVTEISLNTVKVQNWDKTISTIPTYSMVSESFTNWRGMQESGGRRIKRHIKVDMRSVKFCTQEMLERYKKIIYLKDYVEKKQEEITQYNKDYDVDETIVVNGRRMTNIGVFRKYLEMYLKNHPMIHKELTFLVRHLQPDETGLPIEIYVFSVDKEWANYESIQADILDHILAVIPEFDLRVFQNPSGEDFRKLMN